MNIFSISVIRNLLLPILAFTSFFTIINILIVSKFKDRDSLPFIVSKNFYTKTIFNINFILVFFIFSLILYSFISYDFSLNIVANSTSKILPLPYRIGAIWASQEGSLILWLFIIAMTGFILLQNKSLNIFQNQIALFYLIQIFCLSLILLFFLNPFLENLDKIEPLGLNPVLQDIALTIHPPILYIGYALSYAIFVLTMISVIYENKFLILFELSYFLIKICLFFISIGVFLGSWWAYRELGWGGYWFFDPVENISLLPLFAAIAYYHTAMVQLKDKRFEKTLNFLGISIFLLILIGTCFTRSGLIVSVHSFVNESSTGYYLISFSLLFAIISYLYIYIYSNKYILPNFIYEFNKKSSIRSSNYLWIISIILILISLIVPIISNVFFHKIITIESNFFITILIPILLFIVFIMGVFSYINKTLIIYSIIELVIALIIALYVKIHFKLGFLNFFGFFVSIYIIEKIFVSFISSIKHNRFEKKISMVLSHFGIGLLCLSITLNKSFEKEFDVLGKIGEKVVIDDFQFQIKNLRYSKAQNYIRQIIDIEIKNKQELIILSPERRLYIIEKSLSSESNIMSFLFFDIYAVISNIENDDINITIYYKPFISMIWFSAFLISIGVFISILINKSKNYK
jgi:cytochrome c-type biogenesis protein CcmF